MPSPFPNPFGPDLELSRYPERPRELLLAWDAADQLILEYLRTLDLEPKRILILNDSFGALSCAIEGLDVTSFTDSYLAARALEINSQGTLHAVGDLRELRGEYDLVIARIPKNLSFFEEILARITPHLKPGSELVCGTMVKYQTPSSFELIERYFGPTRTSLAEKKARLIFAEFTKEKAPPPPAFSIEVENFPHPFVNLSNLFSREKLDIGTRFLLEHLPESESGTVLDLGCGNGILGIALKRNFPGTKLIFTDESQMALESARINYRNYFPEAPEDATFLWTNAFENGEPASVDFVICNPPFHQGNTLSDFIALQMFADAKRALRPGGILRMIGNSHLRYPNVLKKVFGDFQIVAKNAKFTIVDAFKSRI